MFLIVLLLGILFYNYIPNNNIVPAKVDEYVMADDIKVELEKELQNLESEEIIKTYQLDAMDLEYYERTREYNKGKVNPFYLSSGGTSEGDSNGGSGGNGTGSGSGGSSEGSSGSSGGSSSGNSSGDSTGSSTGSSQSGGSSGNGSSGNGSSGNGSSGTFLNTVGK